MRNSEIRSAGLVLLLVAVVFRPLPAQGPAPQAACQKPEYRVFDFWVGDWEVENPSGQEVGVNRIETIAGGCALLENWTSARGGSGKSLNYYNPATGKWRQTWVDASGRIIEYEGAFEDGVMRFTGQEYRAGEKAALSRMTFTSLEPNKVRQLIEHSLDGGQTWTTWFDGLYIRKAD